MMKAIGNVSSLVVIFLVSIICSNGSSIPEYNLPIIKFGDLTAEDPSAVVSAVNALTTVGALQITEIPHFTQVREDALDPLAGCLKSSLTEDSITQIMPDGSFRLTAVASSVHGKAGKMTSTCGDSASKLRSTVDSVTKQLFRALDNSKSFLVKDSTSRTEVLFPYVTYEDVLRNGEHLEHLHSYFSPSVDADASSQRTFEYHTDAGLFIAMTTGLYSGEAPSEASGLYVELPSGVRAKAVLRDDALVILVGDGGARWLESRGVVGTSLRAVPHALVAGLRAGSQSTRSWYGKMFLPPGDALIPGEQQQRGQEGGMTFQQYQQRHSRAVAAAKAEGRALVSDSLTLPTACGRSSGYSDSDSGRQLTGGVLHTYYHLASTATTCTVNGEEGIICWMQCQSVADLSCGQSAECVDSSTGQVVDGDTVTCPTCIPQCPTVTTADMSGDAGSSEYCFGTGVIMYMEGFTSIAYEKKGSTECLNLVFLHWTLDTKLKFGFACVGVLLFGVFVQYLTLLRHQLGKQKVTLHTNALIVAVHGVQIVSGYFAMLVAMTYSIELFCMVCAGLTIGFALFNIKTPGAEITDPAALSEDAERLVPVANPIGTSPTNPQFIPAPDNL